MIGENLSGIAYPTIIVIVLVGILSFWLGMNYQNSLEDITKDYNGITIINESDLEENGSFRVDTNTTLKICNEGVKYWYINYLLGRVPCSFNCETIKEIIDLDFYPNPLKFRIVKEICANNSWEIITSKMHYFNQSSIEKLYKKYYLDVCLLEKSIFEFTSENHQMEINIHNCEVFTYVYLGQPVK